MNYGLVYKSDREQVNGWESIEPKKHSPAMVRYLEAQHEAEQAWRDYTANVDYWMENGLRAEMEKAAEHAETLDARVHVLYNQANCPHEHIDYIGGFSVGVDGLNDNIRPVCRDCGAEIELDVTGEVMPDDQIPF